MKGKHLRRTATPEECDPGVDEFGLIKRLNARQQSHRGVVVGIGDDAAVVRTQSGTDLVLCCDALVEGVHFLRTTMQPYDIGWKSLAVNLSDMAAMGARPRYALISLGAPTAWPVQELEELYRGLYDLADEYGVQVVGGDTVASPQGLFLSVTVVGEVALGQARLRSGACPGDILFLTGTVGDAAAGLHLLLHPSGRREPGWERLRLAHQRPHPHLRQGGLLTRLTVQGALNDISDGLASECWEIAEASGVQLVLEEERLPLSAEAVSYAREAGRDPLEWALYGGEDYVLLGTARKEQWERLERAFRQAGLPLYRIGLAGTGEGVLLVDKEGRRRKVEKMGYNHFRQAP